MSYRIDRPLQLVPTTTIGAAHPLAAGTEFLDLIGMRCVTVQATLVVGAGGTSVTAYVQTTFDATTWIDIMAFGFLNTGATKMSSVRNLTAVAPVLTGGDGALTDDTILDGVLGLGLRCKWVSVGVFTGVTTLTVNAVVTG